MALSDCFEPSNDVPPPIGNGQLAIRNRIRRCRLKTTRIRCAPSGLLRLGNHRIALLRGNKFLTLESDGTGQKMEQPTATTLSASLRSKRTMIPTTSLLAIRIFCHGRQVQTRRNTWVEELRLTSLRFLRLSFLTSVFQIACFRAFR